MIPDALKEYTRTQTDSKIKVSENGRQAVFLNPERAVYFIVQVDGGLIKNTTASDYVVSKADQKGILDDLVIELKGTDVNHALDQVMATANYWQQQGLRAGKIAALIVCARMPKFDTKVQRCASAFAKSFKGPLHVCPRNDEFVFENVFSFRGPK
jgi:hypothetical protein